MNLARIFWKSAPYFLTNRVTLGVYSLSDLTPAVLYVVPGGVWAPPSCLCQFPIQLNLPPNAAEAAKLRFSVQTQQKKIGPIRICTRNFVLLLDLGGVSISVETVICAHPQQRHSTRAAQARVKTEQSLCKI